jgi:hypothetical protein
MLKPFLAATFAAVAMLSGCANTSGGDAKVSRSGFHQSAVINIDQHGTAAIEGLSSPMTSIGAQWQQQNGDGASLFVAIHMRIIGITGAALNIDGDVVTLTPSKNLTSFETTSGISTSTQTFGTSLNTIRRITTAKRVWLKVNTTKGWVEDAIIDGDKDSKAFHALKRFIAQVDAVQADRK